MLIRIGEYKANLKIISFKCNTIDNCVYCNTDTMGFKILTIDGGGTKGVIPAKILNCLEQDFGQPALEWFDLLAGTSTGGVICLGLACGLKASQLVDLYLLESDRIFHESLSDRLTGLDEHLHANYQHKNFHRLLSNYFGDLTLGDLHVQMELGKKKKEIMVCSFDLNPEDGADRNRNYRPVIFHSAFQRDQAEKLVDVALRTTAAPTYFPIYQKKYIDGGVAMNNPAMAAIAYAMNDSKALGIEKGQYLSNGLKGLKIKREKIKVLSLGTGSSNLNRIESTVIKAGNWGNIQWIKYLPQLMTESNIQSTIYYARHVLPDQHFMRIDPSFDDPALSNPLLAGRSVPMDTTDQAQLEAMVDLAERVYEHHRENIRQFLEI